MNVLGKNGFFKKLLKKQTDRKSYTEDVWLWHQAYVSCL
jgi:hypothetical protein